MHLHLIHLVFGNPPLKEHEEQAINEKNDGVDDPCYGAHVQSSSSTINIDMYNGKEGD